MSYSLDDTIVAVASPPGGAARGIVRLGGPRVVACLRPCFRAGGGTEVCELVKKWGQAPRGSPISRRSIQPARSQSPFLHKVSQVRRATALPGTLHLEVAASGLPCDLYLWPGRRSYTGAPMAEVHTIGSGPLLEAAVRTFCRAGARLAEPGEFTLRAFLAGRIDLTRAEAVLGVVDAVDSRQLDVALAQLAGGLSRPLSRLRDDLLDLLAQLEAGFDFADEDLPFITPQQLGAQLAAAAESVDAVAGQLASRAETAELVRAVLVGWPNTGKSSLFNALAGTPGALVAPLPGTTRDYLVAELDLDGVRCRLIDTAGVDAGGGDPADEVGRAAQAVAAEQSGRAHVHLLCLDSTRPVNSWERAELGRPLPLRAAGRTDGEPRGLSPRTPERGIKPRGSLALRAALGRLIVLTKTDQPGRTDFAGEALATSSVTGAGIDALRKQLRRAVLSAGNPALGAVAGTAARSGESIRLAGECLGRARELAARGEGEELVAAEIRTALGEVGKVVGAVYTDDVLDRIFGRFCIGK